MHAWAHLGPASLAAFFAAAVESTEALTVVLAVGAARGWRDTFLGVAVAVAVLLVAIASGGSAIARFPRAALQIVVGVLAVLFGLRWLQKAILRAADIIPHRDEDAAFAKQVTRLGSLATTVGHWDAVAFGMAFQVCAVEGIEVVFIVVALGAGGTGFLLSASFGAAAGTLLVACMGVLVHRPLSRVPENILKFAVGVLLSASGTFWLAEGADLRLPGVGWSLPALVAAYLAAAMLTVRFCRTPGGDERAADAWPMARR